MLRVAPPEVLTTTVMEYVFEGVPAVGPTTPGLRYPPAQPDAKATRNNPAVTVSQVRRRRRAATKNTTNATNRRSRVMARSGAKLRGKSHGTGRTAERDGAVVVTVVVMVIGAFSVNEPGDEAQVPAGIALLQETVTTPLNPPAGAIDSGNVADCPALIVAEVGPPGGTEMMMSVPSPDSVTACGLPGALSVIVIAPARAPAAVGVKVTEIVQEVEVLAETPLAQVSVSAKSPLALMLVMVSAALPGLVTVTTRGLLVVPTN